MFPEYKKYQKQLKMKNSPPKMERKLRHVSLIVGIVTIAKQL